MHSEDLEVDEILWLLDERRKKGNAYYYKPLDPQRSGIIRTYYRAKMALSEEGQPVCVLVNGAGTVLALGYTRVVVGDYGAYVECSNAQIMGDNLAFSPSSGRKYTWLRSKDAIQTKVYEQHGSVAYADYKPGFYYVAEAEVSLFPPA